MPSARLVRRLGVALAAAACAALVAAALDARPVLAANPVRTSVVAYVESRLNTAVPGPDPDVTLALDAWTSAGADLGSVRADIAAAAPREFGDRAAWHLYEDTCGTPSLVIPPERPRPGDLLRYREGDGADAPWRVAVFLDAVTVAAFPPHDDRPAPVPAVELLTDAGGVDRVIPTRPASVSVCHMRAALMPGGIDDGAAGPGVVTMLDPRVAARRLAWSYAHPRDADGSLLHAVRLALAPVAQALSGVVATLAGVTGGGFRVLERVPVLGAVIGAAAAALGAAFDGRRLHGALTVLAVAMLTAGAFLLVGPAALVVAGALLGARALRVPVLGAAGDALWTLGSFLVSTLTGVDDSPRVRAGTVLLALAGDVLVGLRPLLGAMRLAAPAARLERALSAAGTASDLAALRPRAWMGLLAGGGRTGAGAWLAAEAAGDPLLPRLATGAAARTLDLAGLAWRPGGSLVSDLVTHGADLAGHVAGLAHAPGSPMAAWAARQAALDPASARILAAALPGIDRTAAALRGLDSLAHMHSGGRLVANLVAGEGPPLPSPTVVPAPPGGAAGPNA